MTPLLVIGATGLFGQAFLAEARRRGLAATGAARRGADIAMDIGDERSVAAAMETVRPALVVNTAAMIDIGQCEENPGEARRINAEAAGRVAEIASAAGARVAHISTDHFYTGDGDRPHREEEPVVLLNAYARTKREGEERVLDTDGALVVRTNILGFRGWPQPTFVEWALATIREDRPATLFEDSFISALDVGAAARCVLDLSDTGATGIVNVGCREVYSKKRLVERLADAVGRKLTRARAGSVGALAVRRAESLGLDVNRAERLLGRSMPNLDEVLEAILETGAERHAI